MAWFTYVLECRDGTLYCGVTTDLERRVKEHNSGARGARYTRARRPVALVASWRHDSQGDALRDEHWFRTLDRRGKKKVVEERRARAG
jgi:putative endonuclease